MKWKTFLFSFILILCIIIYAIFSRLDKTLSDFAQTFGENRIFELVNQCILETTQKESAEYNSICKIHYDSAGKITAITVDPERVNKIKGETVSSIIRTLKDNSKEEFSVPLGTLLGSRLFSAKGPKVNIEVIPLGAVASELIQKFTSVGINQTLHSLYLDVRISVKLASPFSESNINVQTNVCIAETVIIGDIPFAYLD
ncbi:MAG: sporulation protein YunB [Ruminococcaceae bacterium]|nr:sporulation protein YunB [Oscillospiraceae bacterium]